MYLKPVSHMLTNFNPKVFLSFMNSCPVKLAPSHFHEVKFIYDMKTDINFHHFTSINRQNLLFHWYSSTHLKSDVLHFIKFQGSKVI